MKQFATWSNDHLSEASVEFRIGTRSIPYLADHGFQDLVVLPGSFYIEMALYVDRALSSRVPGLVRNVVFHNAIILSAVDAVIKVAVRDCGDGRVEYTFYEAGVEDGGARSSGEQYAARLEIDRGQSMPPITTNDEFSVETFQTQSEVLINSEQFYKTLRDNGNQYGPDFQNVDTIWRAGDQSLGKLSVLRQHGEIPSHVVHPSLLDSITQLLAPFIINTGKTFVLRSIDKVEIMDVNFPDTLWGHVTRLEEGGDGGKGVRGDVRVFDQSGKPFLNLSGVEFTLLDGVDAADEKLAADLVIASNFTAEPLEDSLQFWGDHFGVQFDIEFAPYNQIFQQLLDQQSAFRRNRNGVNVIVLGLEEWTAGDPNSPLDIDRKKLDQCFGTRARCVLPNRLEIVHLNQYETDYVYKEIFEDECYLRHGVRLRDGDTVVDIGANIGLFSLFVMSRCRNPRIYACEPAPVVYDLLKANCDAYGSNVTALNVGVSDVKKTATFTFYEKSSVFSSFHPNETEDREAIQAVVRNMLSESVSDESIEEYVSELTADRLHPRPHECSLTSVSDIIRENQIERIDLLKIDAEKSELDIIKGIEESDWPKIRQIVLEIHDATREAVNQIEHQLIARGYRCAVEQETLLEHSGLFNLYATRDESGGEVHSGSEVFEAGGVRSGQARRTKDSLTRNVQEFSGALRSFMNHAKVPLVLCFCPESPAAEADAELQAALNDAEAFLISEAGTIANVLTIGSASPLQHYRVKDYHDPHSRHVGHIPYTPECYAAIGTTLVRAISTLKRNPYKVIVLDCDNTLWKGVCGEDGPQGIEVSAPYRRLQEFMIDRQNAGMLLCLCSKNAETDVLDVFEQRTDMPLKREHLVAWRINWGSKSANVISLAKQLNLGLDSLIFIDDNPVECADVRVHCPDVLTLQLPQNAELFSSLLDHTWAFDQTGLTEEDQNRTQAYQENAQRQQYRAQVFSLKDFIRGLQLRIEIDEATEDQLVRIAQLTIRTNQFNFTTVRRSESEISDFLKGENAACLGVRVADRFGDYGLVGALMYEAEADRYRVDTFLLSCRVLGRGVEHAIVARLGQLAIVDHKRFVEFPYSPTKKNLPALQFINSIGSPFRNAAGTSWTLPAEHLISVAYDPNESVAEEVAATNDDEKSAPGSASALSGVNWSERLPSIGANLYNIDLLTKAIDDYRFGKQPKRGLADVTSGNALETSLVNIWRKVLGRPRIGVNDNFFEVGGTSLRAVQVVAMIKRKLNQALSIVTLFECPTVTLLAAKLSATADETPGSTATATAAARGQQRRYNTMRRKT